MEMGKSRTPPETVILCVVYFFIPAFTVEYLVSFSGKRLLSNTWRKSALGLYI